MRNMCLTKIGWHLQNACWSAQFLYPFLFFLFLLIFLYLLQKLCLLCLFHGNFAMVINVQEKTCGIGRRTLKSSPQRREIVIWGLYVYLFQVYANCYCCQVFLVTRLICLLVSAYYGVNQFIQGICFIYFLFVKI